MTDNFSKQVFLGTCFSGVMPSIDLFCHRHGLAEIDVTATGFEIETIGLQWVIQEQIVARYYQATLKSEFKFSKAWTFWKFMRTLIYTLTQNRYFDF